VLLIALDAFARIVGAYPPPDRHAEHPAQHRERTIRMSRRPLADLSMPRVNIGKRDRRYLHAAEGRADIDGDLLAVVPLRCRALAGDVLAFESVTQVGHGCCGTGFAVLAHRIGAGIDRAPQRLCLLAGGGNTPIRKLPNSQPPFEASALRR
jgi:hypothetical protein